MSTLHEIDCLTISRVFLSKIILFLSLFLQATNNINAEPSTNNVKLNYHENNWSVNSQGNHLPSYLLYEKISNKLF